MKEFMQLFIDVYDTDEFNALVIDVESAVQLTVDEAVTAKTFMDAFNHRPTAQELQNDFVF